MAEETKTISGVQKLIDRLREDGIKAGQQETGNLIREAKEKAAKIVADARAEAERLRKETKEQNEAAKAQADEALRIAMRNTEHELGEGLRKTFQSHVKRLVAREMQDEQFLRRLLEAIVRSAAEEIPQEPAKEILIPEEMFQSEALKDFVRRVTSDELRDGIELKPSSELSGGINVKLVGEDVVFDFSDNALSDLILKHLLPRYRAILTGVE